METGAGQEDNDCYEDVDEVAIREDLENTPSGSDGNVGDGYNEQICLPGMHSWHDDMCMVCTVCQECTGYSVSCLSSMRPDRIPGQ